jgi:16S rRNA (uracil1498-N3)-methyltransferase
MDASTTSSRVFVPLTLAAGAEVVVGSAVAHHLGTVLRRREGAKLRLFNGRDGEWSAEICALRRGACRLRVEARLRAQEAEPDLWLAFAPLKRDATDLVVEKATELGVAALLPVITARTVAARVNPERLTAIATAAAEQCERLSVPRLAPPVSLPELLAGWPPERILAAALERRGLPPPSPTARPACLLIGPEGGFSAAELDLLARHPLVTGVGLGARVLRAETAAIAGLALLGMIGCGG